MYMSQMQKEQIAVSIEPEVHRQWLNEQYIKYCYINSNIQVQL